MSIPQNRDCNRDTRVRQTLLWKTLSAQINTFLLAVTVGFSLSSPQTSAAQVSATGKGSGTADPSALTTGAALTIKSSPIVGLKGKDLHDSFSEIHNGHRHEAIDIMEPRGTQVHAVADGIIKKIFFSKGGGGKTIYEFDQTESYCYYYAHLDGYAPGLHEGQHVSTGEVIGYTSSTGNASHEAPHLHFAVYELGRDKRWWRGRAIDPYPRLKQLLQNAG
jgi:peptidoglycan LD-endopeptidase LytH